MFTRFSKTISKSGQQWTYLSCWFYYWIGNFPSSDGRHVYMNPLRSLLIILLFFHNFLCRLFSNMSCSLTLHWKICKSLIIPSWNICSHVDEDYENRTTTCPTNWFPLVFTENFFFPAAKLLYVFVHISSNIFNINVLFSTNNDINSIVRWEVITFLVSQTSGWTSWSYVLLSLTFNVVNIGV